MKKLLCAGIFVLLFSGMAAAHPPTDLELKYDAQAKTISIHMRHVTADSREHYIRTITVSVNEGELKYYRYTHQQYPSYVDAILPVEAKPGDTIHVIAKCIQGGSMEGDFVIPQEVKKEGAVETGAKIPEIEEEAPEAVNVPQNLEKKMP